VQYIGDSLRDGVSSAHETDSADEVGFRDTDMMLTRIGHEKKK
jgi:hypothetical protein